MWLENVSGLQVGLTDRQMINFTSLILTTGKGLRLRVGLQEEVLIFRRFVLSWQNSVGKSHFRTPGITIVIMDRSLISDQTAITRSIRLPAVTVILTGSSEFYTMCTKRALSMVSIGFLLEVMTAYGEEFFLER